jgi:hypothetical protein
LADALIYCNMTAGPDGHHMTVEHRLADIRKRYAPLIRSAVLSRAASRTSRATKIELAVADKAQLNFLVYEHPERSQA